MKRLNLPLISDTLFTALCAFLLFFTAVRFYTKSPATGLVFGILACLLFGTLGFLYIGGKQDKKLLLSKDEKNKKLLSMHLSLSSDAYIKKLFKSAAGEGAVIRGNAVIKGDCASYFNFKMSPLDEDDMAAVIKSRFNGKKKIYCSSVSPAAENLAENFAVETISINEVYSLLKEKNLLPEKYIYEEAKKISIIKRIKARFSRKLRAPLFWSGTALIAMSYITFYPVYYIVSGSLLLILAAASLVVNQS